MQKLKKNTKGKSLEEYKKIFTKLYKDDPYLMVHFSSSDLAKQLNLSPSRMRQILSYLNISFKKDIKQLILEYPPDTYTYKEVLLRTKSKLTRNTLNKYSILFTGSKYIYEKDKVFKELLEEWEELLKDYKYPLLQLGMRGIRQYLGLSERQLRYFLKQINYTESKQEQAIRMFRDYDLNLYAIVDIAHDLGVKIATVHKWKQRYYMNRKKGRKKKIKPPKTVKRVKKEIELYGLANPENRKMSMKEIKKYFEDRLIHNGEISTKELRELGYKAFNKWLYTIRKRYGLKVKYEYDKHKLKYVFKGLVNE